MIALSLAELREWLEGLPAWAPAIVGYAGQLLGAIGVLAAAWIAGAWAQRAVVRAMVKTSIDKNVGVFAGVCAKWGLRAVGLLLTLGVFGIETTSLAALVGGAGVGVGLALRGSMANLASGLLLLTTQPFRNGDIVRIAETTGRVRRVSMFTTSLDTFDNRRVVLPNDDVFSGLLENFTHHPRRRVDVSVGVAYDSDLDRVVEVLTAAADSLGDGEEPPVVRCTGFGASSIDFLVGLWSDSEDFLDRGHALRLAIKHHLDEAEITIPFPQRTLHVADPAALEALLAAK